MDRATDWPAHFSAHPFLAVVPRVRGSCGCWSGLGHEPRTACAAGNRRRKPFRNSSRCPVGCASDLAGGANTCACPGPIDLSNKNRGVTHSGAALTAAAPGCGARASGQVPIALPRACTSGFVDWNSRHAPAHPPGVSVTPFIAGPLSDKNSRALRVPWAARIATNNNAAHGPP